MTIVTRCSNNTERFVQCACHIREKLSTSVRLRTLTSIDIAIDYRALYGVEREQQLETERRRH